MTRVIKAITERTAQEWPKDHPLRQGTVIIPDDAKLANSFLVCSFVGDKREPPRGKDRDIFGPCAHCQTNIIWRASADQTLPRICIPCFRRLA